MTHFEMHTVIKNIVSSTVNEFTINKLTANELNDYDSIANETIANESTVTGLTVAEYCLLIIDDHSSPYAVGFFKLTRDLIIGLIF